MLNLERMPCGAMIRRLVDVVLVVELDAAENLKIYTINKIIKNKYIYIKFIKIKIYEHRRVFCRF